MVARTDANVLITGESGTGKELVARAVHEQSRRLAGPLVKVNCASIPTELFESEFFGHVRGAFTGAQHAREGRFELADGGTLFLDEVGEIPLFLQGKLLRVLQERQFERVGDSRTRQVDVRIVAATNRDLLQQSGASRFRQDLYYRLSVFPIHVPALRERPEDIAPLLAHFVALACARHGVAPLSPTAAQVRDLESYDWPGNVRELQNVVDRAVIVGGGHALSLPPLSPASVRAARSGCSVDELTLDDL
jgi:transcriptional regulator with GAF, ATPase, and Fis domain